MGRPEWFVTLVAALFLVYCAVAIGDALYDSWGTWRLVRPPLDRV